MLKIREDFDLNELKNYGFKQMSEYIWELRCEGQEQTDVDVSILVNMRNRNCREVYIYVNVDTSDILKPVFIDEVWYIPDVLIDLIKKGIVVKG